MRSKSEDMTSEEAFRRVQEMDTTFHPRAHYDPIFTPIFGALFSAPIFGLSAAGAASAASIASAIAVTSTSQGVNHK